MLLLQIMRAFHSDSPARTWLAMAAVAGTLLFSSRGLAQAAPDELARRHFESAAAYFEQAEYEEALVAFQKAYELSNRPQILRNISIVQERLGNLSEAIAALDEYLEKAGDDPAVGTMRIRRDNLSQRLERQQEKAKPPAVAAVAADATGDNATTEHPGPAAPPQEGLPPESHYPTSNEPDLAPAYILLSVGGLAGAGALLTGVVADLEYQKAEKSCRDKCSNSKLETSKNLATTSTVLTGVSVLSVGVGLIWWLAADGGDDEHVAGSLVDFSVTPRSAFAEASFRF